MPDRETLTEVATFLLVNADQDICDACIAASTGLAARRVASAGTFLGRAVYFLRDEWQCVRCGHPGAVTRALSKRILARQRQRPAAVGSRERLGPSDDSDEGSATTRRMGISIASANPRQNASVIRLHG
jgi:ribosomal protein S14